MASITSSTDGRSIEQRIADIEQRTADVEQAHKKVLRNQQKLGKEMEITRNKTADMEYAYQEVLRKQLMNEIEITKLETLNTLQNLLPDKNIEKIFDYNAVDFRQILLKFFYAKYKEGSKSPFEQLMYDMAYLKRLLPKRAFEDEKYTFEIFLPKAIMLAMLQSCVRKMLLSIKFGIKAELAIPTLVLNKNNNKETKPSVVGEIKKFDKNKDDVYAIQYALCAVRLLQAISRRVKFSHGEFDTKHIKPIEEEEQCVGVYMDLSKKSMIAPYNTYYMLTIGKPKTPVENKEKKYYILDDLKTLLKDIQSDKFPFAKRTLNKINDLEQTEKSTEEKFDIIKKSIKKEEIVEDIRDPRKAGGYKLKL